MLASLVYALVSMAAASVTDRRAFASLAVILATLGVLVVIQILVEADAWSPGPADAPPPDTPPANAVDLYETIERLGLDVETIAPVHGRGAAPFAELATFIGR